MAAFPDAIWDGSSKTRPVGTTYSAPDGADWQAFQDEVITIEEVTNAVSEMVGAGNSGALARSATTGFTFIPTCEGTPTGTPAAVPTGYTPLIYDVTNDLLYFYDGGWIKSTAYAAP